MRYVYIVKSCVQGVSDEMIRRVFSNRKNAEKYVKNLEKLDSWHQKYAYYIEEYYVYDGFDETEEIVILQPSMSVQSIQGGR